MTTLTNLNIKLFADGADKDCMLDLKRNPMIQGFTTNPTLLYKAGVGDYNTFALEILKVINDKPISFEVFADEFDTMELQAREIASWGSNVYVKIPVTDTRGASSAPLIRKLVSAGVNLNITALMTLDQVRDVSVALADAQSAFISVFAGRIADSGRDPVPMMAAAVELLKPYPNLELIWASPREVLNIVQANAVGCHIITLTPDLLGKLSLLGKDLHQFSLETVRMFHKDASHLSFRMESMCTP